MRVLSETEVGTVAGGKITAVKVNRGNAPNGNANGMPTVNENPTGKAPPGQNMRRPRRAARRPPSKPET